MASRTAEKVGWIAGWTGAFVWVLVLSIVFVGQGEPAHGWTGLALVAAAAASVVFAAPWRFPSTPYWRLLLAPYAVFVASLLWAAWAFGGLDSGGLAWWNIAWLLPLAIPMVIIGDRRWDRTR